MSDYGIRLEVMEKARLGERAKPTAEERARAEVALCSVDGVFRAENHRWIKDKRGEIRKIGKLKLAQRKTIAVLDYLRNAGKPAYVVIGKSRKQGESTIIAEDCYEQVKQYELDALVLSFDRTSVGKIFKIYSRFYQHDDLPKPLLYKGKGSLYEMKFDGHDGHITVATAHNVYAGTGETPQYIHFSEGAKSERGNETLTALLQSVGDEAGTTVIHESTFNGMEPCFLPIWQGAYQNSKLTFEEGEDGDLTVDFKVTNPDEWNGYVPVFVSVLDDEDAKLSFESEQEKERFEATLDADEKFYREHHGAGLEFLHWRRRTIKLKCKGNVDVFKQEYPVTPEEAIRVTGRPVFDLQQLDRMPVEEGRKGRLARSEDGFGEVEWRPDVNGPYEVFRTPQPGHHYIVGADPCGYSELDDENLPTDERRDSATAIVFDMDYGNEEVCVYENQHNPEVFARQLVMLGQFYRDAFIVVESNADGSVTAVKLGELYDPSLLYHRDDWNPDKSRQVRAIGHRTMQSNRDICIGYVTDAISQNDIVFHSKQTVDQLRFFQRRSSRQKSGGKLKAQAARGKHDDRVSATWLARAGLRKAKVVSETKKMLQNSYGNNRVAGTGGMTARISSEAAQTRNRITGY